MIKVHRLQFRFRPRDSFLLNIENFEMQKGERVFLEGPSGSGKSTFLSLLSGLIRPDQGEVEVHGRPLSKLSEAQRDLFRARSIGFIFQQLNLLPYLNVRENILVSAWNCPERMRSSAKSQLLSLAKTLDIEHLLDRPSKDLSIGEQQRVAVARALMGPPQLLIADEPTSALDEERQEAFMQLLLDLAEKDGLSMLFVSHNPRLSKFFDRHVRMNELNQGQGQ